MSSAQSPRIEHLVLRPQELVGDQAFWAIYEASFPPEEKDPPRVVLQTAEPSNGMVFCTRAEGRTLALATVQHLREVPYGFLIYLAVAPECKGQGHGGALLNFASQAVESSTPACHGLIWEVDRPQDADDEAERNKRTRRLGFFQRHAGRHLEAPYLQPALDGEHVVPMHLMTRLFAKSAPPDLGTINQMIQSIYFEKYAAMNGVSPLHLEDLLAGKIPPRPAFP